MQFWGEDNRCQCSSSGDNKRTEEEKRDACTSRRADQAKEHLVYCSTDMAGALGDAQVPADSFQGNLSHGVGVSFIGWAEQLLKPSPSQHDLG